LGNYNIKSRYSFIFTYLTKNSKSVILKLDKITVNLVIVVLKPRKGRINLCGDLYLGGEL